MPVYLDASALVKLAIVEPESEALVRDLEGVDVRFTSVVGSIELARTVRRRRPNDSEARLEAVIAGTTVLPLHVAVAAAAGALGPSTLRTLDAIHLATLRSIEGEFDGFYCYDGRLAEAASEYGIPVRAPR